MPVKQHDAERIRGHAGPLVVSLPTTRAWDAPTVVAVVPQYSFFGRIPLKGEDVKSAGNGGVLGCLPRSFQVASVDLKGFVNGLAVSSTGKFFVAAVGQEHRLGRWESLKGARNEVCVVPLPAETTAVAIDTDGDAEGNDMEDMDGEETG